VNFSIIIFSPNRFVVCEQAVGWTQGYEDGIGIDFGDISGYFIGMKWLGIGLSCDLDLVLLNYCVSFRTSWQTGH